MTTLAIIPLFVGTTELILLGGLALLLFGGKKLPEMMKGLGQGVQNFKKGMSEPIPEEESHEDEINRESESEQKSKESQQQIENSEQQS